MAAPASRAVLGRRAGGGGAMLLALALRLPLLPVPLTPALGVELIPVTLFEEPRERRRISGEVVVGLAMTAAGRAEPAAPGRLAVELPPARGLRLCGRLESRDGTYFAWFDEPVGDRAGPVELELRRTRALPLPRREPPFLAVLVYLAQRCDGRVQTLLPATPRGSGPSAPPPSRVSVLVNSGGMAATLVVPRPSGPPRRTPCRTLEGDDLVVFDSSCEVELEPGSRVADAFLELRRGVSVTRHPLGPQGP